MYYSLHYYIKSNIWRNWRISSWPNSGFWRTKLVSSKIRQKKKKNHLGIDVVMSFRKWVMNSLMRYSQIIALREPESLSSKWKEMGIVFWRRHTLDLRNMWEWIFLTKKLRRFSCARMQNPLFIFFHFSCSFQAPLLTELNQNSKLKRGFE